MREIKLILKGQPMSKQSVRGGKYGFYQDDEYKIREQDYRRQIKEQLPSDFVMFTKYVYITKCHVIHSPTKAMLKSKKRERLEAGELFMKPTRPDLPDNLIKLAYDSLSRKAIKRGRKTVGYLEGVYRDDGLIVGEDNKRDYWGLNPRIEIELKGE